MAKLNSYSLTPVKGVHYVLGINKDNEDPNFDKIVSMTIDGIVVYTSGNINIDGGIIV